MLAYTVEGYGQVKYSLWHYRFFFMKVEKTEKKGKKIQKEEEEKKIGKKTKKRSRGQLEIKYVSFNIYQPHKSFSFLDFFRYINKL